jgi:glycerate 2-kinase
MKHQAAIDIFLAGVESVKPDSLIKNQVSLNNNILQINSLVFDLSQFDRILVTGAGKASALMAKSIEQVLGNRITEGHVITKYGHGIALSHITLTEAAHPIPDENGILGTEKIISLANTATAKDLFLCLLSGGASALMTDIPAGCTLEDVKTLNQVLLQSRADISEINCIRKHLSKVKGGQLVNTAYPATVISLILSDVVGDRLEVIASGPTAPDPSSFANALHVLRKYNIEKKIPPSILNSLVSGSKGLQSETPKPSDPMWKNVYNVIIGSNKVALRSAKEKAESLGYQTLIITHELQGEANQVAVYIEEMTKNAIMDSNNKKMCLLFGGEPTVEIKGTGIGGRNQHLALLMVQRIRGSNLMFLAGGTDGTDGPTDVAGGIVDSNTWKHSIALGCDPYSFIDNYDSYRFFQTVGGHLITGPTQTNVMDIALVLIGNED